MIFKPSIETQIEKAQEEIDDSVEALIVLDGAVRSTFLLDKHNLILQEWEKEYKQIIEGHKNFIEEARQK